MSSYYPPGIFPGTETSENGIHTNNLCNVVAQSVTADELIVDTLTVDRANVTDVEGLQLINATTSNPRIQMTSSFFDTNLDKTAISHINKMPISQKITQKPNFLASFTDTTGTTAYRDPGTPLIFNNHIFDRIIKA